MQYLTFMLGAVEYAVEVGYVDSIVEAGVITDVPSRAEYAKGVMDLRGCPVPVVDMRRKVGLPPAATRGIALVLFAGSDARVGALVDDVTEVAEIDGRSIQTAAPGEAQLWERYVKGVARVDGRLVVVVEGGALLAFDELRPDDRPEAIRGGGHGL